MIKTHEVKSWVHLFGPMMAGLKMHDLRLNDRDYVVGDRLLAREYDAIGETGYTGREALFDITYITGRSAAPCAVSTSVLPPGYVILSIKLLASTANAARGWRQDEIDVKVTGL